MFAKDAGRTAVCLHDFHRTLLSIDEHELRAVGRDVCHEPILLLAQSLAFLE
jgi:hypothetical protein